MKPNSRIRSGALLLIFCRDSVVDFKNDVLALGEVPLVEHHAEVSILVPDPLDTFGKLLDPCLVSTSMAKENIFAREELTEFLNVGVRVLRP